MKLNKLALLAAICCGGSVSAADGTPIHQPIGGQHPLGGQYPMAGGQYPMAQQQPMPYQIASPEPQRLAYSPHDASAYPCDCGEAVCGCEAVAESVPGCDGSGALGCNSGRGSQFGASCPLSGMFDRLGSCDLGEPWTLFGEHCGYSVGGWVSLGYHSKSLPLFNSRPHEYQVHQAWLYAEKALDTSNGFGLGGRIDYLYGTDAQDTQAFGIDNDHWDNSWDRGPDYGQALPQAYLEAGYGDLSFKVGHFYTIIGYEVVSAPDNFFYSHAYTMYNSEPFTHTGALGTYKASNDVTVYGGYVLGWDSGFEDNGDAFLGGVSLSVTDSLSLTYAAVGGRFDDDGGTNERGYMHSVVADLAVSERLQYIFQTDVLDTHDALGATVRETFDINQYLIYTLSDCWAVGGRFEWWQVQGDSAGFRDDGYVPPANFDPFADEFDFYALTLGLNYRPHANVVIRPEIRWDWIDGRTDVLAASGGPALAEGDDDEQTTFGVDTIFLF